MQNKGSQFKIGNNQKNEKIIFIIQKWRNRQDKEKERTRGLIQVGAIFEKYFDIVDVDQGPNQYQ
jgi:hypothetical protein